MATNTLPPICPRLSKLGQTSPLDPKTPPPFHIIRCQGAQCAIFVLNYNDDGTPTGTGHCADVIVAIAQMKIANAIEEFVGGDEPEETPSPKDPPASA